MVVQYSVSQPEQKPGCDSGAESFHALSLGGSQLEEATGREKILSDRSDSAFEFHKLMALFTQY